jgi:DNA polymerase-1
VKVFHTEDLDFSSLSRDEKLFVYNGLDSAVTLEVWEKIHKQLTPEAELIYTFERAQLKPAMSMMQRGIRVDLKRKAEMLRKLEKDAKKLEEWCSLIANAIWGKGLNPRSTAQLNELLYDKMRLEKQYINVKGERKVSVALICLEKLHEKYMYARPLINAILALRDVEKRISVLRSINNKEGRFHASFNVGGTETGRWSSSKSVFGFGWNAQNITYRLREIFMADEGHKLAYADLSSAESYVVACLAKDYGYLQACMSGDLHTAVARMVWPDLDWTGDLKLDRKIADKKYYRTFSYRDMAKRAGHASNYNGTAWTIARVLKVPQAKIEEFQDKYFTAFPGIRLWHSEVQQQLQGRAKLQTPIGRVRHFFGRTKDDATLREAIAHVPQSTVGDILNLGLYRVWKNLSRHGVQILAQVHDAILFQYPTHYDILVENVMEQMSIEVVINGIGVTIPVDAEVGYYWGNMESFKSIEAANQVAPSYAQGFDVLDTLAG